MQVCPACGRENPDGFLHCGFCTASLTAPVTERRKLATLLFCDLSGSTALGERVDAESVQGLLRTYFQEMRGAVERHGGTVEKFIGDAVVAAFGVPEAHEDDALRACRAALEMQERMVALNEGMERRFGRTIAVRIGVNTGEVVTGGVMSEETFVTGDAVNVAARLEQAAAPGEVLLGEPTYRLVRDAVRVETLEPLTAKGKSEPLQAYRLLEVTAVGQLPRRADSPLVGREAELALLEQEFETAVGERCCRLMTVVGEPGVGKSRLAAELVARVRGARVVRGACLSYGEGITFWPVAQIVRELAGISEEHSAEEARARLDVSGDEVGARLAQLLGLAEGATTADQIAQAIARFLAAAAAEQPLIVLVDDIHWAEPALLDLLLGLPARIEGTPVQIIGLARPELLETYPDWPVTVRLEPLGAAEVDALLESLDAPAAVRVRIALAAGGNPLYAEELVAWVREGGDLEALPTTLNALLGARLDRLEGEARDALERGAVEGELFHRNAVVELSEEPTKAAVPRELERLTGKDLIRPTAAGFAGEMAYRFKHILVREAAYRATAKKLRASLHERFADWLERLAGERVGEYREILGYHLEQAYRYRDDLGTVDDAARALALRAARHLAAAGRRANDRADVRAGANLLGRATGLLPVDSIERLELLRHLAYAVDQTGRMLEARAIGQELYERASALGERGLAAHGKSFATPHPFFDRSADPVAARAAFEEAVETFTELGDQAGLAAAKRRLGLVYRSQGNSAVSIAWLEAALEHANACDDQSTRRAVAFSLAVDLSHGPMPVDDAIVRCEELREASRDDRVLEAAITRHLSLLYAMSGRFDVSREYERRAAPVLEEAWVESLSWGSLTVSAEAKLLAGDRVGAERDLSAKWRAYPVEGGTTQSLAIDAAYRLANLYCGEGRWEEAAECLAVYRHVGHEHAVRLAAEARLAAHHGEHDEAVTLAQRAVEIASTIDRLNMRAQIWLALAEVQQAGGQHAEADAAVDAALELYEQKGNIAASASLRAGAATA